MRKEDFVKMYGKTPTRRELAQVVKSYNPSRLKWTQEERDRVRRKYKSLIRWN